MPCQKCAEYEILLNKLNKDLDVIAEKNNKIQELLIIMKEKIQIIQIAFDNIKDFILNKIEK